MDTGSRSARGPATRTALVAAAGALTALLLGATAPEAATAPGSGADRPCRAGHFCAWGQDSFTGRAHHTAAAGAEFERCIPLPDGLEAKSFANSTHHSVTVYQDPDCDTDADFSTHPPGSQVPEAPYVARAIQVWRS
ncbi:peptidase inhibitor family I36 protein [Saccharopolyspora montiporae]|nr:peptidase inhibitor family I36 protein [Saccharopolyspora sp. HNM0983]